MIIFRKVYVDTLNNNKKDVVMSAIFLHKDELIIHLNHQLASIICGFEHCILSQSGWAANVGLIQTILLC